MSQKIRFYADEHIAKAVILGLRQRGVDILAVKETEMLSASDAEHFKRAQSENRVIVTQDDDFLRFHAVGQKHSGIVYAPQGKSIGEMIQGLLLISQVLDAEEMQGQIEFL